MSTTLQPISRYAERTLSLLFNRWHLHTSAPVYGSGRRRGVLLRYTGREPPFESRNIPASVVDTLEQAGYIYARIASSDRLTVLYDLTSAARSARAAQSDPRHATNNSASYSASQRPYSAPQTNEPPETPPDPITP